MKKLTKELAALSLATAVAALGGCGGTDTTGATNPFSGNGNPAGATPVTPPPATAALFQPEFGILPYPTDLYFVGSTDGTLNIQPPNATQPWQSAVNALDGYSTTAVIREQFGSALDPTSFSPANVIIIPVNIDNSTKATVGVAGAPLTYGVDYTVNVGQETGGSSILEITPKHPLTPSTGLTNNGYLVLLMDTIKDAAGGTATADTDYATIKAALPTCTSIANATLNGICQLTGAHLQIAQALGINPAHVVVSFSFSTQSIIDTMAAVAQLAKAMPIGVQPTGLTTLQVLGPQPGVTGDADIYVGTLQIPYYLSRAQPLTGYWHGNPSPLDASSTYLTRFNPVPVPTETLTIPVLMTVPNALSPSKGIAPGGKWPLVIYEHGIGAYRAQMLPMAEAFAGAGFAMIAIDLPLHGITDTTNPLYAGAIERTFNLDLENNATGAPGPDGIIDPSGSHYINLASLLTSRDNLREGEADLMTLVKSVTQISLPGGVGIDGTQLHFVGLSLGSITGTTFLAMNDTVGSATLAAPGGGVASLLRYSPSIGPLIAAGLEQQGLLPGTTPYEEFFRDAQTVVDSGDAWNFMAAASSAHPIHVIQVVGSATSLPDQTIPNFATQRVISAGSLAQVSSTTFNAGGLHGYVNFTAGSHDSIWQPTASVAATVEMQTEAVVFALTNGTTIQISNPAVVQ